MLEYLKTFLFGGILFALIKYLSVVADPKYSAVIAAFPIGLVSSVMMTNKKELKSYVHAYKKSVFIILIVSFIYKKLLDLDYSSKTSLVISLVCWLLLSLLKLFVLDKYNKEKTE